MGHRQTAAPSYCKYPDLPAQFHAALKSCALATETPRGLESLASTLGFDGVSYLVLNDGPWPSSLSCHWTSAGEGWAKAYAKHGYHAIDPRIVGTKDRHVPAIWNAGHQNTDRRVQRFLDHAGRFRIRSGVAIPLHDARVGRVVVGWDSASGTGDDKQKGMIEQSLGTLTLLTAFLHEAMQAHCRPGIGRGASPALTTRERDCLELAARGMTSNDMGVKLGITERTVNFHIGNVIDKLGVLNRNEAIARAVAHRIVSLAH